MEIVQWNFYAQGVELDPVMLNLAKDYFGFTEDKRMKVTDCISVHF